MVQNLFCLLFWVFLCWSYCILGLVVRVGCGVLEGCCIVYLRLEGVIVFLGCFLLYF